MCSKSAIAKGGEEVGDKGISSHQGSVLPRDVLWKEGLPYSIKKLYRNFSNRSDAPYLPCARLDDDILYLTYIDWKNVKSRFEVGKMLCGIDDCSHLTYPFLQVIPVRACRVEPLGNCGGYIAVDGEPVTPGSAFQVTPTRHCATVIGRNQRH